MKKILCIILSICLLIGTSPLTVCAAENNSKYTKEFVFESILEHNERGHEVIVVNRYHKYTFMTLTNKVYFEFEITNNEGTHTYKTDSFRVMVWNMKNATIDRACKNDKKLEAIYPSVEKAALNVISERMISKNMSPEELKKELFGSVVESWFEAEKESIAEVVVLEFVKAGFTSKDVLQNIVDKGFDIKDTAENAHVSNGTEAEKLEDTINFAQNAMQWLKKIVDGIKIILAFFNGVNANPIADLENLFAPPGKDYTKYSSIIESEKLEYHNNVYSLIDK